MSVAERLRTPAAQTTASASLPVVSIQARQVGMLTLEQKRVIEDLVGKATLARVVAQLPEDRRQEFEALSLFSWCRCSTLNMVLIGVAEAVGRDVDGFTHEVVRRSFGVVLRTVWRLLARFSSEASLVQRASVLYSRAIDQGFARAWVVEPGYLVLEISDRPDLSHVDIVSIAAAIEAAFDVAGRRMVVTAQPIRHGVRYEARVRNSQPAPEG